MWQHLSFRFPTRLASSGKESKRWLTPREVLLDLRKIKILPLNDGTEVISELPKRLRYALDLLGIPEKPSGIKNPI